MSAVSVPTPEVDLYKPLLLRGVVSLAFGVVTVFIPDMSAAIRSVLTGIFFVLTALSFAWLWRIVQSTLAKAGVLLGVQVVVAVVGGIIVFTQHDSRGYVLSVAIVLAILGAVELVLGVLYRKVTVLGRDWLIVACAWLLGALGLLFLGDAGSRAPLGILGAVAVITGVALILAALSYRHDSRGEA